MTTANVLRRLKAGLESVAVLQQNWDFLLNTGECILWRKAMTTHGK